jgi:hypothetical protein
MVSVTRSFLAALLVLAFAPQNTYAKCPANCDYCSGAPVGLCAEYGCIGGYGLTPQKICAKCPANCTDCNGQPAGQCKEGWCANGYGLTQQNTCLRKCPQNCDDCDSKDVPAGQCKDCADGYGLSPQNTCSVKCPANCDECDSKDVPAGQCKYCPANCDSCDGEPLGQCNDDWCSYGYNISPQKTCIKDCGRFDCCTYDCPKAKAGTCADEAGHFGDLKPIKVIKWKTTAKRLTVETCQAACLSDPSCFAYRFYGTQKCVGSRPCTRCSCKVLGQHDGDCSLYGADAKDQIQAQSFGTAYTFITRVGGYCWH